MSVPRRPALVVPDEATWTMAGHDPAALGLVPVASAETAQALLAPDLVPEPLAAALLGEWRRSAGLHSIPGRHRLMLRGRPLEEVIAGDSKDGRVSRRGHEDPAAHGECSARGADDEHSGHERHESDDGQGHEASGHDHHDADGGHDHHDMMAIVGEPSADGLVMESIDFRFGPLTPLLPGGLTVDVSLDGDVVAAGHVAASLRPGVDGPDDVPDALVPVAWRVADAVSREVAGGVAPSARVQWERLAAVELERALSHLTWLRSLGRILGWAQLIDTAQRGVGTLAPQQGLQTNPPAASALTQSGQIIGALTRLVEGRRFAARTRGRGLAPEDALVGPNGRAAGARRDAREEDPLYRGLGFQPVVRDGGDAHTRALVRVIELEASLDLAQRARERAASVVGEGTLEAFATAAGARVEGPRGPVLASRSEPNAPPLYAALGADAALAMAGEAIVGLEWSAALVVLASFDLTPWKVGR